MARIERRIIIITEAAECQTSGGLWKWGVLALCLDISVFFQHLDRYQVKVRAIGCHEDLKRLNLV